MLKPRCRDIEYVAALSGFAPPIRTNGARMRPNGISFYDVDVLFSTFDRHGVNLSKHWDSSAYRSVVAKDAADWYARTVENTVVDIQRSIKVFRPVFNSAGVGHLL